MKKLTANDSETKSADILATNIEQLKGLLPEAFTEGNIDFDVLKQLLGDTVDEREEKYGLNWHGKRRARQLALTPSTGTLRPCPEESVDWDTTQNLMIEGDNLEVLKLLQKSYAGKVKLIYIDPPYNTGKDFIYPDDFQDNIKNYLMLTGQIDSDGRKMSSNTEASGRFHTDWLNMMYPRLKLARDLLQDDGVIFISIDDQEADSLRKLCSEVFGEENFVAQFVWNTEGHTDNQFDVKVNHEYVLLFARNSDAANLGHVVDPNTRQESNLWKGFAENSITKNGPANPPSEVELPVSFPCSTKEIDIPASMPPAEFFSEAERHGYITREMTEEYGVSYPIRLDRMQASDGRLEYKCHVFSGWANVNKLRAFIANQCQPIDDGGDRLSFYLSEKGVVYYRRERERARSILSVLRNLGTTEKMSSELEGMGIPFQYPKPKELLRYLVQVGSEGHDIILDFFAGSGTLAHSVWLQEAGDRAARRFILVQLPEPLDPEDEKQRPAVQFCDKLGRPRNIAELTKERLRRTGKKIREENPMFAGDVGFRVFKLASSNIRAWEPDRDNLAQTLEAAVEHLKTDRTEQDILYELLLKLGLDLTVPIEEKTIAGKAVHSIGAGTIFVCLAKTVTTEEVEPLAQGLVDWHNQLAPAGETTCVFRDSAFADDVAKTNLTAILQQHGLKNVRSL
ncbi:site-specific DNA-methyltransferase [Chloroflexota bacterium]